MDVLKKKRPQKYLSQRVALALLLGFLVTLGMLALYLAPPGLVRQMDYKVYDSFLTGQARGTPSPVPLIVDIDEASLAAYGQWPWPRYLLALLLTELTEAGASAVALDVMLAEPDRSSPMRIQQDLQRHFGQSPSLEGLEESLHDNDALLAEVLAQTPTVLGMFFRFNSPLSTDLDLESLPAAPGLAEQRPAGAPPPTSRLLRADNSILPLPSLRHAASAGFINVAPDNDGIIRAVPLLATLGKRVYPNLSLQALMTGLGVESLVLKSGPAGLESLHVGGYTIPVSREGMFRLPYRGGRGVYPYISAGDVLQGAFPADQFAGRVVFVGSSAAGLLDIRATPFDAVYPGVEVHATFVDAVLSERFIDIPPWTDAAQIALILLMGLLSTLLFGLARPVSAVALGLGMVAALVGYSSYLFRAGIYLSPLYGTLSVGLAALVLLAFRFWQEERQKRVLRQAFSRYVAPEIVTRIAERGQEVLAGEEREVTILFADVRGFTTLSESLNPQQVVRLLNRYFTPMTACIRASGGTLDKFIGDAVMAFWNAPFDIADHPDKAVRTALRMRALLDEINPALAEEFGVRLGIGVGIHTGSVFVGDMGSEELLDYTCIGDNVNLASRLESLSSLYGQCLLLSSSSAARCGPDLFFRKLDVIRVKGKRQPVEIGTVWNEQERRDYKDELNLGDEAFRLYRAGSFALAENAFLQMKKDFPNNAELYTLFEKRCRRLLAETPANWDGIWTFDSK